MRNDDLIILYILLFFAFILGFAFYTNRADERQFQSRRAYKAKKRGDRKVVEAAKRYYKPKKYALHKNI